MYLGFEYNDIFILYTFLILTSQSYFLFCILVFLLFVHTEQENTQKKRVHGIERYVHYTPSETDKNDIHL